MTVKSKVELDRLFLHIMTAAVVIIVVLMPVHAFVSTWLGTTIGPLLVWKSWKEILLALLIPLVVWYCVLRPDVARIIWSRLVNKLVAAYVLLHLVMSPFSTASAGAVVAGLMMNLRFLAIFVLVQVIVQAKPKYLQRLLAVTPRWLMWVGLGLGVLALLQVYVLPHDFLVQFGYNKDTTIAPYILVDQNPNALRAFATMRGPNTLGAYMIMPVVAALFWLYGGKRRDVLAWATLTLGLMAIYLTGSRSAWLGLIAALVTLALILPSRALVATWTKILAVPVIVLTLLIGWAAVNIPSVRLTIFHSSPGDSSLSEGSTDKHWEATANGIASVVRHPLGSGPGSAGPASFYNTKASANVSEDYYVQIAQEVGLIGLALFVAINVLAIRNIVRRSGLLPAVLVASFAGISLINIFLHGWADDPTALTWWALAGLYMGKR
jgi:putative inorganic carbon (HCO3(-)) transporter